MESRRLLTLQGVGVFKILQSLPLGLFSLRPHPRPMEVPRLGVKSEVQLLAYATATATPDLSCVCDLQHSSQQRRILNPLSEARDRTCNLLVPSWIHFRCATMGTSPLRFLGKSSNPLGWLKRPFPVWLCPFCPASRANNLAELVKSVRGELAFLDLL